MGQIHCLVISAEQWWQGDSFFHSVPTAHSGLCATLDIDRYWRLKITEDLIFVARQARRFVFGSCSRDGSGEKREQFVPLANPSLQGRNAPHRLLLQTRSRVVMSPASSLGHVC